MHARVVGQLGMERGDEERAPRAGAPARRRAPRAPPRPGPALATRGARMNTPRSGSSSPSSSRSASKLATWRPYALRATSTSTSPRWSRSSRIIPAQVPKTGRGEAADRLLEPVEPHQPRDRGRLAARDDQAVEPVELLRLAHLDRRRRRAAAARPRARGSSPARRGRRCGADRSCVDRSRAPSPGRSPGTSCANR